MSAWQERARCAGTDPDAFFQISHTRGDISTMLACLDICADCPVSRECLADAMEFETSGYRYGIYGGLLPEERRIYASTGRKPARVIKSCKACGRRFIAGKERKGGVNYCSSACQSITPRVAGERVCEHCGDPYRPISVRQRFCTPTCHSLGRSTKERPCRNCGVLFQKKRVLFCSTECQKDYRAWQQVIAKHGKTCRYCETDWNENWECRQYCTVECQRLARAEQKNAWAEKQAAGPRLVPRQCPVCGLLYQGALRQKACSPKCLELMELTS